jgi:hypothetical protein
MRYIIRERAEAQMRALSAMELLDVWERGQTQSPIERALTLLAAAQAETSPEKVARLSLGRRDGLMLALREWTFGPHFVSLATCPACGQRLELAFDVGDIRVAAPSDHTEELSLCIGDYAVRFRLPNSLDLGACHEGGDLSTVRQLLLQRCLLHIRHDGAEAPPEQLPAEVTEAIVECMAATDPQADVQLALACPHCGHHWQAAFDINSFFWQEIDAWAQRTLREVHILASRYGWREMDILAMSARRRQWYLNLVNA